MKSIVRNLLFILFLIFIIIGAAKVLKCHNILFHQSGLYHGLKGEYYKSPSTSSYDFAELKTVVADEVIDFYPDFTPLLNERVGQTEGCAVRWTGMIQPKYSEVYTFHMVGDNGFRLWIGDILVLDHWVNDWEVPQKSKPVSLKAGNLYNIKIEYFNATGGATLKLEWSSPSQEKEVVPMDCLYQPFGSSLPVIKSVEAITVTTDQYSQPLLPTNVNVEYTDGTKKELPVTWDFSSDPSLFDNVGSVEVCGKIIGKGVKVKAIVQVNPYKGWKMQQAPLMTKWADQIDTELPLPEYPRMQMQRADWLNLNGLWQFQPGSPEDKVPTGKDLEREILVPYPMESALSGVKNHYDYSWYRRLFSLPENWSNKKIILNFGAVDFESEVFVNGVSVGTHKGGYDPFSYNITPYLKSSGQQELIVKVFDDTGKHPKGKQTTNPEGIWYTPTSGIWQTVWIEPVSEIYIKDIKIVPDIDKEEVKITVNTSNNSLSGQSLSVNISDTGLGVTNVNVKPGEETSINIPNPKLWTPDDPFLYDLDITLASKGSVVDHVKSYFGMRKISIEEDNGLKKIFLNNKFTFLIGPLDQGFWPDGIYTAPTDEALRWDIEQEKNLGFNAVRKHVKVEPDRWYYWADKLGILVVQDMPSANNESDEEKKQFENELHKMVETHWNHPSIINWVVFNEGWGQYDTIRLTTDVMNLDPNRLVTCASGWNDYEVGHIQDIHSYPEPNCPDSIIRARVNGEYGGIKYAVDGHLWTQNSWGYTDDAGDPSKYSEIYSSYSEKIDSFKQNQGLSSAIYTQITDVEQEVNGLFTYDRKLFKGNLDKIRQANLLASNVIESIVPVKVTTNVGISPKLPNKINVIDENGIEKSADVFWNAIESSSYSQEGFFTVEGNIKDSKTKAKAEIMVINKN